MDDLGGCFGSTDCRSSIGIEHSDILLSDTGSFVAISSQKETSSNSVPENDSEDDGNDDIYESSHLYLPTSATRNLHQSLNYHSNRGLPLSASVNHVCRHRYDSSDRLWFCIDVQESHSPIWLSLAETVKYRGPLGVYIRALKVSDYMSYVRMINRHLFLSML